MGGFWWSPMCLVCENPRFATRFERGGVAEDIMPLPEDVPREHMEKLHEACREALCEHQDLAAAFRAGDATAITRLTSRVMSKTLGQLESFVRHEMAQRQSKGAGLRYVVPGHSQNGLVWAVNTVVRVDDDALDFHENMWVRGRTLSKSRDAPGTTTSLDLIRLHTLDLKA